MEGEIESNTIVEEDFNTAPPSPLQQRTSSRQKISKETGILNDTTDQMHLTYMWNIKICNLFLLYMEHSPG